MEHIRICLLFALLLGYAIGQNDVENDDDGYDPGFEEGGEDDPAHCLYVLADNCPKDALRDMPIPFPDETFLEEHCDDMVKLMQCFVDSNDTCPVPDNYVLPLKGYETWKSFVVDICNKESLFRKSYLKEVDCINSHKDDIDKEARKRFRLQGLFLEQNNLQNIPEEDVHLKAVIRCALDLYKVFDLGTIFQLYCGEGAADLFATAFDRVYDYEGQQCTAYADDVQHYLNLLKEFREGWLDMLL